MKTHGARQRSAQGSFGIPQHMQDAHQAFQEKKTAEASEASEEGMPEGEEEDTGDADGPDEGQTEGEAAQPATLSTDIARMPPRKALAAVGITLDDKDFHSILYRGFVEKEVEVMPALGSFKALVVKIKTLTPDDYNLVDELVAADLENIKGTNAGFQSRRELWTISFAVLELNGRELAKVKRTKDSEVDLKELARERHKMLSQLSPAVINKLIRINSVFNWAITAIVEDPKANF